MTTGHSTKTCTKCKRTLIVESFTRDRRKRDGLCSYCKDCQKQYRDANKDYYRRYRAENAERIAVAGKEWRQANRDKVRATENRYYERNRERIRQDAPRRTYDPSEYHKRDKQKVRARTAINNAVRAGKIPRAKDLRCIECGDQAAQYDHVGGYDKDNYLNVQPVCTVCHGKRARLRDECSQVRR